MFYPIRFAFFKRKKPRNKKLYKIQNVGELKLSDKVVNNFERYLRYRKPVVFLVTIDGQNSVAWKCPHAQCVNIGAMNEKQRCERQYGQKCEIFAQRRSIRWKNEQTLNLKGKDRKDFEVSKIKIDVLKSDLVSKLN